MSGWLNEGIESGFRRGRGVLVGILALLVWTSATASPSTAEETLRAYYRAIGASDCAQARRLRPGYSEKSCRSFTHAELEHVEVLEENANHARLGLRVRFTKKDEGEGTFAGSVELKRREQGWIIETGSFEEHPEDLGKNADSTQSPPPGPKTQNPANGTQAPKTGTIKEHPEALGENLDSAPSPEPDPAVHSPASGTQTLKLLHGSEYLLRQCWNRDELSASQGERVVVWEDEAQDIPPELLTDPQDRVVPDPEVKRELIRSVRPSAGSMAMALTFNLIERAQERSGYDGALVDVLREMGVPATFFASGKWMLSHPRRTRQLMVDPLFELGLLGWDHRNLALLDKEQVERQLLWGEAAYRKIRDGLQQNSCAAEPRGAKELSLIAPRPTLFRFPYGRCEAPTLDAVAAFGIRTVQWSLVLDDIARDSSRASIREQVEPLMAAEASTGAGRILIGHGDGRGVHTAAAMREVIPRLQEQGYEFVTVSQLLALGEPDPVTTCYEREPGDNPSYDAMLGGTEIFWNGGSGLFCVSGGKCLILCSGFAVDSDHFVLCFFRVATVVFRWRKLLGVGVLFIGAEALVVFFKASP